MSVLLLEGYIMPRTSESDVVTDELWAEYRTRRDEQSRNALISAYLPLVRVVATKISAKLPKSGISDFEDLCADGVFGLNKAIKRFEPDRGVGFATYATPRIRGSILDALRVNDEMPRVARARGKRYARALWTFKVKSGGRMPTDGELAKELGIAEEELEKFRASFETIAVKIAPLEEVICTERGLRNNSPSPLGELAEKDELMNLLSGLSRREYLIITLYYYEELTMWEIGAVLRLSESRICQIYKKAMRQLRRKLIAKRREHMYV